MNIELSPKSVDQELQSMKFPFTFNEISNVVLGDAEQLQKQELVAEESRNRVLISLEMYVVLCDKFVNSRSKVDRDDKIIVKVKRRLARAFIAAISKRMERKPGFAWVDAPLPKSLNESLAEQWLKEGLAKSKDEVFVELNQEQQGVLDKARIRWKEQRQGYVAPTYGWVDAPLFGIPKDKDEG